MEAEVIQPRVIEPQVIEPQVIEPQVTEPQVEELVMEPPVVEPEVFELESTPYIQPESPDCLPPEPQFLEPKHEFSYQDDIPVSQRLGPERYVEEVKPEEVHVVLQNNASSRTVSFPEEEEDTDDDLMPALEDRIPAPETPPRIVQVIHEPYEEEDFSGEPYSIKIAGDQKKLSLPPDSALSRFVCRSCTYDFLVVLYDRGKFQDGLFLQTCLARDVKLLLYNCDHVKGHACMQYTFI